MRALTFALLALALTGCPAKTAETETGTIISDLDNDGYDSSEDCNDADPDVYPNAMEVCDGTDNDCDMEVDEDALTTWYADADNDGFGDDASTSQACERPEGTVPMGGDCDDQDPTAFPSSPEVCDGVDNNCDNNIDEGLNDDWYADTDGDGYGDIHSPSASTCQAPSGYVDNSTDCNDKVATIHPDADEVCDGLDQDCDDRVDENALDAATWYMDYDHDGHGSDAYSVVDCTSPTGFSSTSDDCDDGDGSVWPGAPEACDGADNDCNGVIDDATETVTWYRDADGDGFGDALSPVATCEPPSGHVSNAMDCDDGDPSLNPAIPEVCDGIDNDCDGTADDGALDAPTWYIDYDHDGWGSSAYTVEECTLPPGFSDNVLDCDDRDETSFPDGLEVCDGADNDCDGAIDDDAADRVTLYQDADGDGYGLTSTSTLTCAGGVGWVGTPGDCDDGQPTVYPGAMEVCDSTDNDCNGAIDDEATDAATWYQDADRDTWGDLLTYQRSCDLPEGWVDRSGDCDDANDAVSPEEPEICNAVDDDCDGRIDADSLDAPTWYADTDGDLYGDPLSTLAACNEPDGYTPDASDCDDTLVDVNPTAVEICNNDLDDDCDGLALPCATTLADAETVLVSTVESEAVGAQVEVADVNGDGWDDVFGSTSLGSGKIYVELGPFEPDGVRDLALADGTLVGETSTDRAGFDLSGGSDYTGDGVADILNGAPSEATAATGAGACYVSQGFVSGEESLSASFKLTGTGSWVQAGTGVSDAGDTNGDGVGDFFCGAYTAAVLGVTASGGFFLVQGPVSADGSLLDAVAVIGGETYNERVGKSGSPGRDVDGDGLDDFIVGSYMNDDVASDAGAVFVEYAPFAGEMTTADAGVKITGATAGDNFGLLVRGPGDLDEDGYADVLVSSPYVDEHATDGGRVYLFRGPVSDGTHADADMTVDGDLTRWGIGTSLEAGKDFDGDGHADLLVGTSSDDTSRSGALLFWGPLESTTASAWDAHIQAEAASDAAGAAARILEQGSVDGDPILLMGASGSDRGANDGGAIFLLYGIGM